MMLCAKDGLFEAKLVVVRIISNFFYFLIWMELFLFFDWLFCTKANSVDKIVWI